jgi:uncharacterized protein (TIGR00369 family)
MTRDTSELEIERALRALIDEGTPHNRALGLRLLATGRGEVTCTIPYSEALAVDVDAGAIDEGAIATLMDVSCGGSVCMRLGRLQSIATLELRIDFVRPPGRGRPVTARGHCYQLSRSVAFVRALAHDGDPEDLVACAQGTFIVTGA